MKSFFHTGKGLLMLLFFTLISNVLMAQRVIRGVVVDAVSGTEIAHAEVRAEHGASVVSNAEGRFVLHTDSVDTYVVVTMMGYRSSQIALRGDDSGKTSSKKEIKVRLTPQARVLNEVLVMSPENILKAAIENIEVNFPTDNELMRGFYRETVRKRNTYVSVTEAVCEMFKRGYHRNSTVGDRVRLIKGRTLMSQRAKDTISVHVEGGPSESLILDLVKNKDLLLNENELQLFTLEIMLPEMLDGRQQIVIGFKPNGKQFLFYDPAMPSIIKESRRGMHFGKFYIDRETLTFSRIELNLDCTDEVLATREMLRKKPRGMRFHPHSLLTEITYSRVDGKSRLSYIRSTYNIGCDWKKRGLLVDYLITSEMVVTHRQDKNADGSPILKLPEGWKDFNQTDDLSHKVSSFFDPDFWSDYNIIEPTESLEKAVGKLKKRQ